MVNIINRYFSISMFIFSLLFVPVLGLLHSIVNFLMPTLATKKIVVKMLIIIATKITGMLIVVAKKILINILYYALIHLFLYISSQHIIKMFNIITKLYNNLVFILNFIYLYKVVVIGSRIYNSIIHCVVGHIYNFYDSYSNILKHTLLYVIHLKLCIVLRS